MFVISGAKAEAAAMVTQKPKDSSLTASEIAIGAGEFGKQVAKQYGKNKVASSLLILDRAGALQKHNADLIRLSQKSGSSTAAAVAAAKEAFPSPNSKSKTLASLQKADGQVSTLTKGSKALGHFGSAIGLYAGASGEIDKLGADATLAEKLTAGIVGVLKESDDVAASWLGGVAGGTGGVLVAGGTPLALATAPAGAIAGSKAATELHEGKLIDNWVDAQAEAARPYIQRLVESGLKTGDGLASIQKTVDNALDEGSKMIQGWFSDQSKQNEKSLLIKSQ